MRASPRLHPPGVASTRPALHHCGSRCFSSGFFDWTVEFSDFTDAFCLGRMRARNKRSADFCSVPARFNAKLGRFSGSDMSVNEFLHCRSFEFSVELFCGATATLAVRIRPLKFPPGPIASIENNARRVGSNSPPLPDLRNSARLGLAGDIFRQCGMQFLEFLHPVRWIRTFATMDFGNGHPYGYYCCYYYDRAYVCSDRFSWFAVPPTP